MKQLWPVCMPVIVLFLAEMILGVLIKRNKYKLKLKKQSKDIFLAKIKNFRAIPGRPTLYIVDVEYEKDEIRQKKRIITHGKFARKYEHAEDVQIVVIPEADMVFLNEESWKEINTALYFLFCGIAIMLVLLIIVSIFVLVDEVL